MYLGRFEREMFWQGRRVFITGHTGFKGSWLSLWLQQLGAEVCGYCFGTSNRAKFISGCIGCSAECNR